MKQLKRMAAVVAALALTFGLSSGHIAAAPTDATLQAGAGTQCSITVLPTNAISFGTFIFSSSANQYQPQVPLVSNMPIFALQLSSQAPLGSCDITTYGTDLTLGAGAIPVNRVSLTQGVALGSLLTQLQSLLGLGANAIPVAAGGVTLDHSSNPKLLASGVVLLGTGLVVVQGALVLQAPDHSLAPGSYTGTITFTGATTTP
ncbi:MAG: hypothetical protein ACRDHN_00600 [Thermomicrobiales bacterium]